MFRAKLKKAHKYTASLFSVRKREMCPPMQSSGLP